LKRISASAAVNSIIGTQPVHAQYRSEAMRIEVLYVPLQVVLKSQSFEADIRTMPISSEDQAKTLLFPGSPTIRIDGEDEQHEMLAPNHACRLCANRGGILSAELPRIAISNAKWRE
jgi:hypothetical protein